MTKPDEISRNRPSLINSLRRRSNPGQPSGQPGVQQSSREWKRNSWVLPKGPCHGSIFRKESHGKAGSCQGTELTASVIPGKNDPCLESIFLCSLLIRLLLGS